MGPTILGLPALEAWSWLRVFSFGKKVAEGWMRGDSKLSKFLNFSVLTIPSPTVYDGPPSPKVGKGF
jgi:hypothetical protein